MTMIQESYAQSLLAECDLKIEKQEREAKEEVVKRIDQIYDLFKKNIRDAFLNYSLDVIVRFTEISVQIPQRFNKAAEIIDLFFERVQTTNQFYIRALLVKAKVVAYFAHSNNEKGEDMLVSLKESISYISKALDLISPQQENVPKGKDPKAAQGGDSSNKSKYAFLAYNASTTLYKVTRFMLRPGWQKFFVQVYQRIYKLLQEVDQADHNWRCRFGLILYQCLYDSEKKPDAYKILDTLWERTKNKPCQFQDSLFRLRVYLCKENNALVANIKKDIQGADPNGWKVLQALQRMRSGLVPQTQIEKQLMTIVNQISLGVLSTNQNTNTTQLSSIMQQRLADAGRIALKFNLTNLASSIISFLGKIRQPSQKALVLNQYNKAELLIKKKGDYVDKKTGMSMNALQIKQLEIENRKQALKIMEKVMLINKKFDNAELIYEGSILVWNIALPFLSEQYHLYAAKALDLSLSLLEQIDSNDHELRTKFHLQLINIYFDNDLMFAEVESNVFKALRLDSSIPTAKLAIKPDVEEDPSLYARPFHRYFLDFKQKVLLKTMQIPNLSPLDIVTQDLWTIQDHKSQTTKIDTLQKCLRTLIAYEEPIFQIDPQEMLVEEQVKKKRLDYDRQKLRLFKRRKLLAGQIAKLSFEWDLNDFAKKACQFVLSDNWDVKNSVQLIISQAHCCFYMAQIKIDQLYQQNCQPLFEEQPNADLSQAKVKQVKERKSQILSFLKKGLQYALITQQNYLIFNGAICLWNNFLHIFRVAANDAKLKIDLSPLLKDYFQAMRNSLKDIESKNIVYYDLDDKIQAFSNIGLVYARLLESQKQTALVQKVCEDLLLTNLSPNTRKLINGIKARVGGGKAAGGKPADPKKGAPPSQKTTGFNDTFILQVSNQLELIQNTPNKNDVQNQIIKCFDGLQAWKPNEQDQSQLQLHAELWVKLARLSSNEENPKMLKYALRCAQKALVQSRVGDPKTIPSNRLRWYSLAEFLSSESLLKLVNPKTQEANSIEGLLFLSLSRAVQAANKGFKCGINTLVLDGGKQVWNVCARLQQSKANRSKLILPIRTMLGFIKNLKQDSQPDLLLLLSQLYFKATWENNLFKQGEQIADMMLDLLPKNFQKSIWEAKMTFMSKQGKNELQAISSIKEAQPSLQAKLWVKLARIALNQPKQQAAYNKAIEILKKQHSVQIVQVLIEYSEWQLRVSKQSVETVVKNLEYASNILIQIEIDPENDDWEAEPDDEGGTVNSHSKSRSLKSKKSAASRSVKTSQKDIKNKVDKKLTISSKSKNSGISRMNRSGRAAKSVKNNNTKSVFSQRQEEPNPQSLNCIHFERLFRIYAILASIYSTKQKKITYALKAYKAVLRMLQKSVSTFNQLQQNAAKLNEKEEKAIFKTISFPQAFEEWITYQFPKEYLQKIPKVENMNFLGTYTLEKPELTYAYLTKLIDMLTDIGLDYQTIPLRLISKYITKYILKNDNYWLLEQLKLKKVLINSRHPQQSSIKIDFDSIKITDEEIKQEIIKVEYQKSNINEVSNSFDTVNSPNLVQPLSKYACWFQIGKLLIQFGEIANAKTHLKEALACAKILSNSELIGKIHTYLANISYLEGQTQQAVQHLMLAHRLSKSTGNWQKIVILVLKNLISIKKYDVLKNFLAKIRNTVAELIEQNLKQSQEKSGFRTQVNELQQLLITVQISQAFLSFKQLNDENTTQNRSVFSQSLANLCKTLDDKTGTLWNLGNFQLAHDVFKQMIELYQARGGSQLINLSVQNFEKIFKILIEIDHIIKDFIKVVNINDNQGGNYNYIVEIQIKIGFLCVSGHCYDYRYAQVFQAAENVDVDEEVQSSELINKFMKTLDRDIKVRQQPQTVKLNQLERALSLLNDLEIHVAQNSIFYPRLLALRTYVQTLRDQESVDTLEIAEFFRNKIEERLEKYSQDNECLEFQIKAFQALSTLSQLHLPAQYFEYLAKFQHSASLISSFKFLSKKLSPNHKFNASMRLISSIKNKEIISNVIQKQKIFNALTKFPTYQQGIKNMPKNSAYIILKFSRCKSRFYFACMINEPETNGKKIIANSKLVPFSELVKYKHLNELMVQCKKTLIKTPIEDQKKLKSLIEGNEKKLQEIKDSLENISKWWLKPILQYLKTPKSAPPILDKDKKGGKDQKKKGGKDEISGYQSPLVPSPCGIQSITFLLDELLYSLPFEELIPTELVSTVSKDSSFFWLSRKLQEINFQSEINNSSGYGLDKGKYFGYDFKNAENNFKTICSDLSKPPESLKMEGIDTSVRLPSLGDYSRVFLEPGYLQIYGSVDLLNHIKFNSLIEQVGSNKLRLLIIHDNLNLSKQILNKFKDLNTENSSISVEQSEFAIATAANLLNIAVIKNRWFSDSMNLTEHIKTTFKGLVSGIYIGATIRQNRKADSLNGQWLSYLHGPAVTRL